MIRPIEKKLVEKIASGQVIIDLPSALKELVENSIDAEATTIDISLSNDGIDGFEVIDNGIGISRESLSILGGSHCTSKLKNFEDLDGIDSLGFRGEAFHSLCSLSKAALVTTRQVTDEMGVLAHFDSSASLISLKPIPASLGTRVRIDGLFNEYAVRLAEWKRNSKKVLSKAISLLQTYAIGYPEIKLRLGLQTLGKPNQILFSTSGSAKTAQVLMEIFGFQAKHFSSIDYQDPERRCRLECVLGKRNGPSRSSGDRQFIFVNKRPSDQIQIQKAINSAYHEKGFSGFPCFIVNIILQSGDFDLNLTPDKRKVKISNEKLLCDRLKEVIEKTCFEVVELSSQLGSSQSKISFGHDSLELSTQTNSSTTEKSSCNECPKAASESEFVAIGRGSLENEEMFLEKKEFCLMRVIGQFNCGFIVASLLKTDNVLVYIIDQHAADERFQLESLWKKEMPNTQKLLCPVGFSTSIDDYLFIKDRLEIFEQVGFRIIDIREQQDSDLCNDSKMFQLVSVPVILGLTLGIQDFFELYQKMKDGGACNLRFCTRVADAFASRACRSAVMIGTPLSFPQMNKILKNLTILENPWICAHGRPTVRLLHIIKTSA